jgi:hypothetical protein
MPGSQKRGNSSQRNGKREKIVVVFRGVKLSERLVDRGMGADIFGETASYSLLDQTP